MSKSNSKGKNLSITQRSQQFYSLIPTQQNIKRNYKKFETNYELEYQTMAERTIHISPIQKSESLKKLEFYKRKLNERYRQLLPESQKLTTTLLQNSTSMNQSQRYSKNLNLQQSMFSKKSSQNSNFFQTNLLSFFGSKKSLQTTQKFKKDQKVLEAYKKNGIRILYQMKLFFEKKTRKKAMIEAQKMALKCQKFNTREILKKKVYIQQLIKQKNSLKQQNHFRKQYLYQNQLQQKKEEIWNLQQQIQQLVERIQQKTNQF